MFLTYKSSFMKPGNKKTTTNVYGIVYNCILRMYLHFLFREVIVDNFDIHLTSPCSPI